MRDFLKTLALSPILIPQAIWTAARAMRLAEAAGPRKGQLGQGKPLRILVTGDSSAAGVGVATQDEALAGQIAAYLAPDFEVSWQVIAKSGGTTASTIALLKETQLDIRDVAVVALGVNDSKNGVRAKTWLRNYSTLIRALQTDTGARQIYVSGLPKLGEFPLLPWPLNGVLGARATHFDSILHSIAASIPGVTFVAMDIPHVVEDMASDGFHPGPRAYAEWARLIADQIRLDQKS